MAVVHTPPSSPGIPVGSLDYGREKLPIRGNPERHLPRRRPTRSSVDSDSFSEPLAVIREARELEELLGLSDSALFPAQVLRAINIERPVPLGDRAIIQRPCDRHVADQYDWILSTKIKLQTSEGPDPADDYHSEWRYYGCNWLIERLETGVESHQPVAAVHTMLATELLGDDNTTMALSDPIVRVTSPPVSDHIGGEAIEILVPSHSTTYRNLSSGGSCPWELIEHPDCPKASSSPDATSNLSPPSSQHASSAASARIEDSVEALDRLEEELEALQSATQVRDFPSPMKKTQSSVVSSEAVDAAQKPQNQMPLCPKHSLGKSYSMRIKPTASRPPLRKSASMDLSEEQEANRTGKKPVTRPSSLLPPKPPAKSTKIPTKPTFELPGEAVARRLKEQREARRSAQTAPCKSDLAVPPRPKSVKAPTIPRFELPGEAISRRKKEQHERLLREQADEERKRREFKAAPIRANSTPASYPRDTAASRARRVKAAGEDVQGSPQPRVTTGTATVSSRLPFTGSASRPSLRKSASTISSVSTASTSSQSRSGATATDRSQTSRGSSSLAASSGPKRTPISAEESERLRLRGKVLYEQDNSYVGERERERRQRELAAKVAREEAAERSRQASREWAERQRRRQSALLRGEAVI